MTLRRISALFLALVLCITVTACTSRPTRNESNTSTTVTTVADPADSTAPSASTTETAVTATQTSSTTTVVVTTTTTKTTKPTTTTQTTKKPKPTTPPAKPAATPLLYKVTDKEGHVIWLFGSIHVGQSSFYPLPDYVMDAFEEADSLAVEFDIIAYENDVQKQTKMMSLMLHPQFVLLPDYIPTEIFDEAVAILDYYGLDHKMLEYYIPIMWSNFIDSITNELIGINVDLGVDRHLLNLAYKQNKTILDIESAEFQYRMLADLPYDLQILLLQSSIADYYECDALKASLQEMMDTWQKGNEAELAELVLSEYDINDFESGYEWGLFRQYHRTLVADRNITMTEYAEEALAAGGDVFICVGAAHVVGDDAMADLLAERGYTVEIVR